MNVNKTEYQNGFDAGYDFCLNEVKLFGVRSENGTQELVQHLKNNDEESKVNFQNTIQKKFNVTKSYGNKK